MNKTLKRILIILGSFVSFIIVATLITVVITAIILPNIEISYGTSSTLAMEVSLEDLIENPKNYDGKYVRVRGIFSYDLEDIALYPSRNAYINPSLSEGHKYLANAIWLNDTGLKSEFGVNLEDLIDHRGKYMVVEGTFNPHKNGHFECFPGTMENISYIAIEKGKKSIRSKDSASLLCFPTGLNTIFHHPTLCGN